MHANAREVFERTLTQAIAGAGQVAESKSVGEHAARQAASALYHVTTAVAMAWEAGQLASPRRMRLAQLALKYRVLPQDPLAVADEPEWLGALLEPQSDSQPNLPVDQIALI
jgi:hypothetical protein